MPLIVLGVIAASPMQTVTSSAPPLTELVRQAWAAHPTQRAADAQARAARHRAEAVGFWPDPMFFVAANNVPIAAAIDGSPMTGLQFRLQQTIPWPGKLRQRTALARAQAGVAAVGPQAARLDLAREVERTFFRIHLLDVTSEVYRENDRILTTFIEVADAKYRVGRGQQQEVLRARLSRDELRQRRIETERQRVTAAATLTQLVGAAPGWRVDSLVDVPMASLRSELTEEALLAMAEEHSPELRLAQQRAGVHGAAAALADIEAWPDLQVGVAYTVRGDAQGRDPARGSDFVSLSLGVGLPVHGLRRRAPVREAAKQAQAGARHDEAAVRLRIREAVVSAVEQLPHLRRQMALLRDRIIPTARHTLEVERAAYQVDRDDMLSLLQTELTLVGRLIEFHALHVEQEILLVELARVLGVSRQRLVREADHASMHEVHP